MHQPQPPPHSTFDRSSVHSVGDYNYYKMHPIPTSEHPKTQYSPPSLHSSILKPKFFNIKSVRYAIAFLVILMLLLCIIAQSTPSILEASLQFQSSDSSTPALDRGSVMVGFWMSCTNAAGCESLSLPCGLTPSKKLWNTIANVFSKNNSNYVTNLENALSQFGDNEYAICVQIKVRNSKDS